MKKVFLLALFVCAIFPSFASASFPAFPMTIWGTLKNGPTDVAPGATVGFYNASGSLITNYVTTKSGAYGGSNATTDLSPTLSQFSGNLTIKVTSSGVTQTLTGANFENTNPGPDCPSASAISFVSAVCHYDINLATRVSDTAGTTTLTGSVTLSGATSTGITLTSGGTFILQSLSGSNLLVIPKSNLTITASGSWDGVILPPTLTTSSGSLTITGYVRVPTLTYTIGSPTVSLGLGGGYATVTLSVGTEYNGQTLQIYRSENGQATFSLIGTCLVSSGNCSFLTNHFSIFTVLAPTSPSGGGGGGGGGGTTTTTTDTTSSNTTSTGTVTSTGSLANTGATSTGATVTATSSGLRTPNVHASRTTTQVAFRDIESSFAKSDIATLANKWVIHGFSDGTFRPEANATRAEYLKIVLGGLNIDWSDTVTVTSQFSDVSDDSQIILANKAKDLGIIKGQTVNGRLVFRPNDPISRAEAIKILVNAAGIKVEKHFVSEFSDITDGTFIPYINKAKDLGIIKGQTVNGRLVFRPNDPISRQEAAYVIVRTLEKR